MRVAITCGASRVDVDKIYLDKSREVIKYLANQGCELNWGSGEYCIMGICYEEFNKHGNKIYGYTTKKYIYELADLPNADHVILDDTFELKKQLFYDSDLLICLPGGIGSVSEPLSFIEEIRSNSSSKKLIIYNIEGWFDKINDTLIDLYEKNFIDNELFSCYKIVNTFEEFVSVYEEIKNQFTRN